MNRKLIFSVMLVCLLAFMVLFTVSCTKAYAQSSPNVRWEYRIVTYSSFEDRVRNYNEAGKEGWEYVGDGVFKRRIP